ncbi:hypothetical protein D3C85_1523200 [compost metagenome]
MKPALMPSRPAATRPMSQCQALNSTEQNNDTATHTTVGRLRTNGAIRATKVATIEKSRPSWSRCGMFCPRMIPARVNRLQPM